MAEARRRGHDSMAFGDPRRVAGSEVMRRDIGEARRLHGWASSPGSAPIHQPRSSDRRSNSTTYKNSGNADAADDADRHPRGLFLQCRNGQQGGVLRAASAPPSPAVKPGPQAETLARAVPRGCGSRCGGGPERAGYRAVAGEVGTGGDQRCQSEQRRQHRHRPQPNAGSRLAVGRLAHRLRPITGSPNQRSVPLTVCLCQCRPGVMPSAKPNPPLPQRSPSSTGRTAQADPAKIRACGLPHSSALCRSARVRKESKASATTDPGQPTG
jgi:hypothetical protein